jgi:hypothetical protein
VAEQPIKRVFWAVLGLGVLGAAGLAYLLVPDPTAKQFWMAFVGIVVLLFLGLGLLPEKQPSKAGLWIFRGLIPLGVAGLAYTLVQGPRGQEIWGILGGLACILFVPLVFISAWGMNLGLLKDGSRASDVAVAIGACLMCFLVIWLGVGFMFYVPPPPKAEVHVDNSSGRELVVLVDGQKWMTCWSGARMVNKLSQGSHQIVVRNTDNQQLDELSVEVVGEGVYVLNLLRAQKYHRGWVPYSDVPLESNRSPIEVSDAWFEPKVDYLFKEPPESIRSQAENNQKTYLLRGPAPKKKADR